MGFSRQEDWGGLPSLLQGIFLMNPALEVGSFPLSQLGSPRPLLRMRKQTHRPLSISEIALLCLTSKWAWCWLQGLFSKAEMIKLLFPPLSYNFQDHRLPPVLYNHWAPEQNKFSFLHKSSHFPSYFESSDS